MKDFDIAVCGAGPVGITLALMLVQHGVNVGRIVLLDAKPAEQAISDPRSLALSYGSRQLLEQIDAWPATVDAIQQIHVSRKGHFGRTLIDRNEYKLPALGYVTRYGALLERLLSCAKAAGVEIVRPIQITDTPTSNDSVQITLSNSRILTAGIIVQAEGGVFAEQTAKNLHRDYNQTAVIAQVWSQTPIAHRAFERFTDQGPLALLPQDDGYALVWCVRPDLAERLLNMADDTFLSSLTQTFGTRLGKFIRTTPRAGFPLGLNAQAPSSARTVAIGNAAQTLHPVAGQGLNLGLRDAVVLAKELSKSYDPVALERFASARQSDRNLTIRLTDTMARIFASTTQGALSQSMLGASLGIIDVCKPAKNMLAEQMMFGWR